MIRKLAWFAFPFAAGCALAQYLLPCDALPLAAAALALLALLGLTREGKSRLRILLTGFGLAAACAYCFAAIVLVQQNAQTLDQQTLADASLTVTDYAETTSSGGFRIRVRLAREGRDVSAYLYGKETLTAYEPGNTLTASVYCTDAAEIDGEKLTTFTSKGVFLLLFSSGEETVESGSAGGVRWLPQRLGRAVREKIDTLYAPDAAGLVASLLTGEKDGLSEAVYSDLSEAGILHIAAVSGLHCLFILAMVEFLVGKRHRRLVAAVAIPVLFLYALMVGASPSVVRAAVMMTLLLLAPLLKRESDPPTALGAALLVILLQNPFAVASAGLQLSFASVAGMLWLAPKVNRLLLSGKWQGKVWRFVAASVSASLGALVFTIPLSAYYFDILVLIAPLSNLLCLPAASFTFVAAMLSVLAGFLWLPLGAGIAWAAKAGAWYLMSVSHLLTRIPYHAVYFNNDYLPLWIFFAYLLFALCCVMKGGRRRNGMAAGAAALTLVLAITLSRLDFRYGALQITVLDVGQGESVLVNSGGKTALLDCGSSNGYISAGDIAADRLMMLGETGLDYLVLTHYHTDHTNGLPTLFSRVNVKTLYVPVEQGEDTTTADAVLRQAEAHGTEVVFVTEDQTLPLGEAALTLYAPLVSGEEESENENGIAILCSAGDFDLLMTGDMGGETEKTLSERRRLPDAEVLVVGHHGSKYSSTAEFLRAVQAENAIISVGDNSYGHPSDGALLRLSAAGMRIYRTDLGGAIRITVK